MKRSTLPIWSAWHHLWQWLFEDASPGIFRKAPLLSRLLNSDGKKRKWRATNGTARVIEEVDEIYDVSPLHTLHTLKLPFRHGARRVNIKNILTETKLTNSNRIYSFKNALVMTIQQLLDKRAGIYKQNGRLEENPFAGLDEWRSGTVG